MPPQSTEISQGLERWGLEADGRASSTRFLVAELAP